MNKAYIKRIDDLEAENAKLREACKRARDLYDHLALGSLEAACKYGDTCEPPTDENCLQVRGLLEAALAETESTK